MKQVNFTHAGGFPLEQETLERLQTAYRSELYEALKRHLSIDNTADYIVAHATSATKGWAVIRQEDPVSPQNQTGILFSIEAGARTNYLKTTRTETKLIYGTGASQTAYYDYEAEYSPAKYDDVVIVAENGEVQTIKYYDLGGFDTITDIKTIDEILQQIRSNIGAIESNINVIEGNINAIETNIDVIEGDVTAIKTNINAIEGNIDVIEGDVNQINGYLAKALVDTSIPGTSNLTLNYQSNWTNTHVGGKIYLDNTNTSTEDFILAKTSSHSLLLTDNASQVFKSNNLLDSLLKRISKLEEQPASAIPIGMVAIWGKTEPIPRGWEEYVPLSGRMPVGLYNPSSSVRAQQFGQRSYFENLTFYNDNGTMTWPFDALGAEGGYVAKSLSIDEMPRHRHAVGDYSGTGDGMKAEPWEGYTGASNYTDYQGQNQSFPILNPYKVVQFIVYVGPSNDTTAPTKPILTFSNIGNSTLRLNWTAASDEIGVTKYLIYKDGDYLAETASNVLTYYVTSLTAGTRYNFYVIARDAAGNLSARSDNGDVTTTSIIAPTVPQNIQANSEGQSQILVKWDASTDDSGSVQYELYRKPAGGNYGAFMMSPDTSRLDTGLSPNTTYYYKVQALDAELNASGFNGEAYATTDPATGGGGGGGCFDIESLVTMASGQSKKLKNIEIGDKLQGFSFPNEIDESDGDYMVWNGKLNEASKAEVTVVGKKASLQPNYFEIKTAETTIKATGQHPLLVSEDGENVKWVCTKNVVQSMLLIDKTGKTKAIESIVFKEEPLEVILLDVEDVDNYVISGIVAHNNKQPMEP
ncbi:fibronectin type III domain-containing protein [Flavobacterium sp. ov086]|uniref:fibronectin type III domain-containing protein n=1 Tax=Flavobacterium sp. ov086 TaxID=1761785 RepID=UPI000B69BD27|nr:fibronectin type III domain-containing protein [Flavobacterium sp. ov086]SNR32967.1 intein N-terminal splicing region [Flavobacterium sp. ov086]